MSNKQSNKQTQSVKVTVNNKITCCDDKKKRRKPKKKQQAPQEQPVDGFPVLDTQANVKYPFGGIAPMAVRNTVYLPNTAQITPEGMQYPVPSYFDRQYTNLTRTMEDFRNTMMNELQDVRNLVNVNPKSSVGTQTTTDMGTQSDPFFDEDINPLFVTPSRRTTMDDTTSMVQDDPAVNLVDAFDNLNIQEDFIKTHSSGRKMTETDRREILEALEVPELQNMLYSIVPRTQGRPLSKKSALINRIIALEKEKKDS